MGDYVVFLPGVGLIAVLLVMIRRYKAPPPNPDACPACHHEIGLDPEGRHCGEYEPVGGWGTNDWCPCQSDYHWNFESAVD